MIKLIKIHCLADFKIHCFFNNGEEGLLDLKSILKDDFAVKILQEQVFKKAKIGDLGEIYWEGIAKIQDLGGNSIPCAYDMSPEFVYENLKEVVILRNKV